MACEVDLETHHKNWVVPEMNKNVKSEKKLRCLIQDIKITGAGALQ